MVGMLSRAGIGTGTWQEPREADLLCLNFLANWRSQALPPGLPPSPGLALVSPIVTQICPSEIYSASSLGTGSILNYVFRVTNSSEASASLEGEVMPCPHDAVTSFPRIFLCGDCSPNQDGDLAHYKLVRQWLCAPNRDRLSGSLASLPLPRTPGQRPLRGASLLGLSAPSPGTQADRHCLPRPLWFLLL